MVLKLCSLEPSCPWRYPLAPLWEAMWVKVMAEGALLPSQAKSPALPLLQRGLLLKLDFEHRVLQPRKEFGICGLANGEDIRARGGSGAFLCRFNPPFTLYVGELRCRGASNFIKSPAGGDHIWDRSP